jgi:hypothetical protein
MKMTKRKRKPKMVLLAPPLELAAQTPLLLLLDGVNGKLGISIPSVLPGPQASNLPEDGSV